MGVGSIDIARIGAGICCAMVLVGMAPRSGAEEIRYHGYDMDDQHRIIVEQEGGLVRVCLWTRGREIDGPLTLQSDVGDSDEARRYTKRECLVQVRS